MSLGPCANCAATTNVKLFHHFDGKSPERLCWDCRWPVLRARVFGSEATGPAGSVVVPEPELEPRSGQTGISDWA